MCILHYVTHTGRQPLLRWLSQLSDLTAQVAIARRLNRLEAGNFGDVAICGAGVHELRVHVGPGYRVYFAVAAPGVIVLLCGGAKPSQRADIRRAHAYWDDYQRRTSADRPTAR